MTAVWYLGGFGRSGSTLLERVLAATTGACALGETVWVWERGALGDQNCGCGVPFSQCDFWQQVGEAAFGGWHRVDAAAVDRLRHEVDRTRKIPSLARGRAAARDRSLEYSQYAARIYAAAAEITGAPAVIDSSKHPSTAFHLAGRPDVELRVLHVVRDSRGVAYSWTKTLPAPEPAGADAAPVMYRYPPWRSALLWDTQNLAFDLLARSGVPTLRVEYERFLRRPAAVVAEIAGFLGASPDVARAFDGERTVRLAPTHQIAGNPMRFTSGELVLREDDEWRSALPRPSRLLVSALTAPVLLRYGYLSGAHGSGAR